MASTLLLWLLISVSDYGDGRGQLVVIERFVDKTQCEYVQKNLPVSSDGWVNHTYKTRCIQARVAIVK